MATEWQWSANVIAKNKTVGNQLAAAVDPDSGGAETFDKGLVLRKISDGSTAWATSTVLRVVGYETCQKFASGGYPTRLTQAGFSNAQIDGVRPLLIIETGARAQYEGRLLDFIAEQGYEVMP